MLFPWRKRRTPWDWVRVDLFPASIWGVKIDDGKLLQVDSWHCIPEWRFLNRHFFPIPVRASVHVWSFTLQCKQLWGWRQYWTKLYWKFTLTPVTPLFKPRMGKWRVLAFFDSGGGGGGEGGRGRAFASRFYSVQDCYSIPQHRLWLPVSRWSRTSGHLKCKNATRRCYSCASKDHNCYHLRGPCLQVKISDKEVSCSCFYRRVIALMKVDAAGEIDSKENSATSANRPRTEWRLTKLHYWLDIGSETNEWSAFIHFTAAGDDLDRVWVKERWISECRKARLASRDRNTPIRLL